MKLSKSQSGFAAIHLLVFLVLFGIIGFTGWKVYDTQRPNSKSVDSATKSNTGPIKQKTPQSDPLQEEIIPVLVKGSSKALGQSVEYTSQEIGIAFTYPVSWGDVELTKYVGDEKKWRIGTEVKVNFSASPHAKATIRSRDYKVLNGGRGGAYWDAHTEFLVRNNTADSSSLGRVGVEVKDHAWDGEYAEKVLINDNNLKVYAACSNFTGAITMNAYPYLKTNKTFDTGNFYFLIREARADGSGLDTTGCDNIDSLIKDTKEMFLQFARSIKSV